MDLKKNILVSENKPPSVVSARLAFIGTLNLPTHFILTTFSHHLSSSCGAIIIIIIIKQNRIANEPVRHKEVTIGCHGNIGRLAEPFYVIVTLSWFKGLA
jgi:hypothetical protein